MSEKADGTLNHVLRNLPPRPAPAGLESRVLQQLERRRTLGWWQRGFSHWPAVARASFISICMVLIGASLLDSRWSTLGADVWRQAFGWALSSAYPALGAIASTTAVSTRIAHTLPANWLYAILAIAAALYMVLFGLSVAAYRTLYLSPPPHQVIR
jgi:hypothetical protein